MFVNCVLFVLFVLINFFCISFLISYIHFLKVTNEEENKEDRMWAKLGMIIVTTIFIWNLYDSCPKKKISSFEINDKQIVVETIAWNPKIICSIERMFRNEIGRGKSLDQISVDVVNDINENHLAENNLVVYADIIWVGPLDSYRGRM